MATWGLQKKACVFSVAGKWKQSSLGFTDILRQRLVTNLNMVTEDRMQIYVYLQGVGDEGKDKALYEKRMKKLGMGTLEATKFKVDI